MEYGLVMRARYSVYSSQIDRKKNEYFTTFTDRLSRKGKMFWSCLQVVRLLISTPSFELTDLDFCMCMGQVAQWSLTNPRDALHHGKRQNFKTVT